MTKPTVTSVLLNKCPSLDKSSAKDLKDLIREHIDLINVYAECAKNNNTLVDELTEKR